MDATSNATDKEEMTDLTAMTDATQLNTCTPTDSTNLAISGLTPSHGEKQQECTNTNSSNQELTRMHTQEPINEQDAESMTLDLQTPHPLEQSGTATGCAETTQDHHTVGYKREHSHSPVRQRSQTSPVQVVITCTCTCTAAGCLEPELVVDGAVLHSGDQGEERQPRKRVKRVAMERAGEGNGCTCK